MKLLLAEDEVDLSNALVAVLTHNHYLVDVVYDGQAALDYLLSDTVYDGVILDIMMPLRDGLSVLSEIRKRQLSVPVLMLTAKSGVKDRILGLEMGADDYLPKPFVMGEFLARVKAMTRRSAQYVPDMMVFANMHLNRSTCEISTDSGSVALGSREYHLLETLMNNTSCHLSTEQLMQRVWGYESDSEINVVWVCISALRRKMASIGAHTEIAVSRGRGYRLEEKQS